MRCKLIVEVDVRSLRKRGMDLEQRKLKVEN